MYARYRFPLLIAGLWFLATRAALAVPSVVDAQVDAALVHRDFEYSDAVADRFPQQGYPKLAPYRLGAGPSAGVTAHFYPGALVSSGAASDLGLEFSYDRAFATKLKFAEGTPYERELTVHAWDLFLGLRARLPLGESELALVAGYGKSVYDLSGDEARPLVPDIHYRFVRVDASGRLALGSAFLGAHLGTRFVTDTGPLASQWFPNAKASSIEAGLSAGYHLSSAFDLLLAADYLRYGFDFNPIPPSTDPFISPVAGGASDTYLKGTLSLRFHYDGSVAN